MDMALESSILSTKYLAFLNPNPIKHQPKQSIPFRLSSNAIELKSFCNPTCKARDFILKAPSLRRPTSEKRDLGLNSEVLKGLLKRGVVLAAMVCGVLVYGRKRAFAGEGVVNAGYGQSILLLRNAWPKTLQVLQVFKEQVGAESRATRRPVT